MATHTYKVVIEVDPEIWDQVLDPLGSSAANIQELIEHAINNMLKQVGSTGSEECRVSYLSSAGWKKEE